MFSLLPTAPKTWRVPVKLLADFRYQKGCKRRPPSNGLIVFIWWLLPTSPQNKPPNKHSEAPVLEKDHKPLLSWITVVPEKSLLSKRLCASYCGPSAPSFPFSMFGKESFSVHPCIHPSPFPIKLGGAVGMKPNRTSYLGWADAVNGKLSSPSRSGSKPWPPVRKTWGAFKKGQCPVLPQTSKSVSGDSQTWAVLKILCDFHMRPRLRTTALM